MEDIIFACILLVTLFLSHAKRKLTLAASLVAGIIATIIFLGTEWSGVALLGAFFLSGVLATTLHKKQKLQFGFSDDLNGRDSKQVLANGSVAAICALIACILPEHQEMMLLIIACSFSSATADTISSELGFVYGRKFYNVLTLKKDSRGENGVVSIEGTLFGIAGSILIALVFSLVTQQFQPGAMITIVLAGTLGNIADSILGATLERNHLMGNNAVNFINTLIAALIGGLLA